MSTLLSSSTLLFSIWSNHDTEFFRDAVDGGWSIWSSWTPCPVTCGVGDQARMRSCTKPAPQSGGKQCAGVAKETKQCIKKPCPGKSKLVPTIPSAHGALREFPDLSCTSDLSLPTPWPSALNDSSAREELERVKRDARGGVRGRRGPLPSPTSFFSAQFFHPRCVPNRSGEPGGRQDLSRPSSNM